MFLIFINDLDTAVLNWVLKFVDDTKLFGKVQGESDSRGRLFDWSEEWQMEFNVDKCKVMHIGRTNKNFEYYMGCLLYTSDAADE